MNLLESGKELLQKLKPILMSDEIKSGEEEIKKEETESVNATEQNQETSAVESPDTEKTSPMKFATALFNGAGVGILLGALLGLAVSPVVSGIIGTLSGLLAVLLGINEKYITPLKGVRIGAFGFFCVAGIFIGMYVRVNNGLLPSRTKMMEEYTRVGYTADEARDFIAYREFNLVPASWKGAPLAKTSTGSSQAEGEKTKPEEGSAGEGSKTISKPIAQAEKARVFADPNQTGAEHKSVLYSSEINASDCYILEMAKESDPPKETKIKFEEAGGTWKELADDLSKSLPENIYIHALLTIRSCFCGIQTNGVVKVTNSAAVNKLSSSDSLDKIKTTLSSSGDVWKRIVENVSKEIPVENQQTLYLSLIKIFAHD